MPRPWTPHSYPWNHRRTAPLGHLQRVPRDAELIATAIADSGVPLLRADSMPSAVSLAAGQARQGDAVLLSPACASFDMFADYQDRGRQFKALVQGLPA